MNDGSASMALTDAGHLAMSMSDARAHVDRPELPTDRGDATTLDERPLPAEREEVTVVVTSRTAQQVWFKQWVEDVRELFNLRPNWNGYGERPVHAAAIKRAARILDAMDYDGPSPAVAPRHDGSIQIEWHNGDCSVELIVQPDEAEAWVFRNEDEVTWTVTTTIDAQRLRRAVSDLLGADV